jgi:hypothetical protein
MKKSINITAPDWAYDETNPFSLREWPASYEAAGCQNVRCITIESRSLVEVVVARHDVQHPLWGGPRYYISSPNYGVAIPHIPTLDETHWITEKLAASGMNAPDAVTVAQVLRDMGDF